MGVNTLRTIVANNRINVWIVQKMKITGARMGAFFIFHMLRIADKMCTKSQGSYFIMLLAGTTMLSVQVVYVKEGAVVKGVDISLDNSGS